MDELIQRFQRELSQLEDHIAHGELHQYIDDNADDLQRLFSRAIQLLSKGEERNAA